MRIVKVFIEMMNWIKLGGIEVIWLKILWCKSFKFKFFFLGSMENVCVFIYFKF